MGLSFLEGTIVSWFERAGQEEIHNAVIVVVLLLAVFSWWVPKENIFEWIQRDLGEHSPNLGVFGVVQIVLLGVLLRLVGRLTRRICYGCLNS